MSGVSFAANLIRYESIDSTSDEARRLLLSENSSPSTPFVVWAEQQTRGRGRSRRSWWSDGGSLTFTIALDPLTFQLGPEHEPLLSLTTALAILDSIEALGVTAEGIGIRWPNDVEIDGRKLAGILPEIVETLAGRRILIGVGLNLSTCFDNAPPEVSRMAISLKSLGLNLTLAGGPRRVLEVILEQLEASIRRLAFGDPNLVERWNQNDQLRGEKVRIDLGSRILIGTARGIGPEGALRVEPDEGGPVVSLMGGQVLRHRFSV